MAELETRSQELLATLTTNLDFSIPEINFDDSIFQIPSELLEALKKAPKALTEADLTSRTIGGSGLFDGLLAACKEHLRLEYEEGRITGAEYARAYVQILTGVLQNAVQYLLGKDQAYYTALGSQIQAINSSIGTYQAKVALAVAQAEAHQRKAQYALGVLQLGISDKQSEMTVEQTLLTKEQTNTQKEQTSVVKAQQGLITEQTETQRVQQELISAQTLTQKEQPNLIKEQVNMVKAQQGLVEEQTKTQQEQQGLIKEQTEQAHAQVSDTRLDGVTPVQGYTGNQNKLLQQQVVAFKKDSIVKQVKIYADSFATQLSMSTATVEGTGLDAANIGKALGVLQASHQAENL